MKKSQVNGAKEVSLVVHLLPTVGLDDALKVALFIASWGLYSDYVPAGDVPTIEGCGRHWLRSRASMYRDLERFRRGFAGEGVTPEGVWSAVRGLVLPTREVLESMSVLRRRREIGDPRRVAARLLALTLDWSRL